MLCTTAISTRSELYRPLVRDFTNSMNSPTEYTRAELTQVYLVQFSSCAVNKALGMLSHRRILSSISILLRHARLIDIQKRLFPHQYMDCVKLQRSVTHLKDCRLPTVGRLHTSFPASIGLSTQTTLVCDAYSQSDARPQVTFPVAGQHCRLASTKLYCLATDRAGFKCVEALGRIIIRGPYPPSNATIYMHLQL